MSHDRSSHFMPKETFYNLSEEKRQRILRAAQNEFARVPLAEAKVARIVLDAGIPRGSFYQYFDDISDLYHYFFKNKARSFQENFKKAVLTHDGDLIEAWRFMDKQLIGTIIKSRNSVLFENALLGLDIQRSQKMLRHFSHFDDPAIQSLDDLSYIDFSELRIDSLDDFKALEKIFSGFVLQAVSSYFAKKRAGEAVGLDQILAQTDKEINWLKYGIKKETEHD
ncbi:TetR/AcrR family transcriptional regulator [Oenococcus sp.]|uniref:TetR/AcrR family transcriptional regulator n=1 Tax=Oenococcus sp. TaxID=1979414 RepID=UPI0039E8E4C0